MPTAARRDDAPRRATTGRTIAIDSVRFDIDDARRRDDAKRAARRRARTSEARANARWWTTRTDARAGGREAGGTRMED